MKKISIEKDKIRYFLMYFVLFPPLVIEIIFKNSDLFFKALQFIVLSYLVIKEIDWKHCKIGNFEVFLALFLIWGILTNLINSPETIFVFISSVAFPIIEMALFCLSMTDVKYDYFFDSFSDYFILLIWLNAFSMIIFPNGIIRTAVGSSYVRSFWLLGSKNIIVHMAPLNLLALIYKLDKKINIMSCLTVLVAFFSFSSMGSEGIEFLSGSTTCIFELIIFLLYFIFRKKKIMEMFARTFTLAFSSIFTIFLSIIILIVTKKGIVPIIFGLFKKDATFSSRIYVWNQVISIIKNNIFWGIGNRVVHFSVMNIEVSTTYSNWGGIILKYGILGLVLFLISIHYADQNQNLYLDKKKQYIRLAFFLMLVGGLMYELTWKYLFLLIAMMNYCTRHGFKVIQENKGDEFR